MNRLNVRLILLTILAVALISALYSLAKPRILAEQQAFAERQLLDLLTPLQYNNHPLETPLPLAAGGLLANPSPLPGYRATLDGRPSAVLLPVTAHGYNGDIQLLVAINAQGQLLGSKVLSHQETDGLGGRITRADKTWLEQFQGLTAEQIPTRGTLRVDGGDIDQISGATVTSRAVVQALQRCLDFFASQRHYLLGEDTP